MVLLEYTAISLRKRRRQVTTAQSASMMILISCLITSKHTIKRVESMRLVWNGWFFILDYDENDAPVAEIDDDDDFSDEDTINGNGIGCTARGYEPPPVGGWFVDWSSVDGAVLTRSADFEKKRDYVNDSVIAQMLSSISVTAPVARNLEDYEDFEIDDGMFVLQWATA